MSSENASKIPGFRPCDFEMNCPAGGICPAQEKLVSQFVGNVTRDSIESGVAFNDEKLLMPFLGGYRATVMAKGCEGPDGGQCPPLVDMNRDPVKGTIIQGLKAIIFGREN